MIEIIYKEENEEISDQITVKTPKNIKQIGDGNTTKKIYIEDYVMNFIKQAPKDPDDIKYGILLGEVKKGSGNTYIFISGGLAVKETMEQSIIFNGEIWTGLYEEIRHYFNDLQIVGWFATYPFNDNANFPTIRKVHLDNFAGNDKVFFGFDRTENEEAFYLYEAGILSKHETYYIYYERNEAMQEYLIDNNISSKPEKQEQHRREGSYRSLLMASKEKEKEKEEKTEKIKTPIIFKKLEKPNKTMPPKRMSSLASSLIIILLLVAVIGVMENYDQMKSLKVNVGSMAKGILGLDDSDKDDDNDVINEEDGTVQVETVNGNVETTTESTTSAPTETAPVEQTTQAAANTQKSYTVQEGETLYSICRKLYNDTSMVGQIISLNNLSSPDNITAGQQLLLP
jgi:LysM repeat protein